MSNGIGRNCSLRSLLLFDLGYTNFSVFAQLSAAPVTWVTRAKKNLAYTVERVLVPSATVCERLVAIGQGEDRQTVRLIELYFQGTWYRYLTNELNPMRLPAVLKPWLCIAKGGASACPAKGT